MQILTVVSELVYISKLRCKSVTFYLNFCTGIRHFSLLNVNVAGACGYGFLCDGGRLVRAYVRLRRGAI